ncbi:MAG: iron ABC transporter permease [Chloroflexi bacterium]|nr:iron ABC transporter permease [Chloroflexota bacterium]
MNLVKFNFMNQNNFNKNILYNKNKPPIFLIILTLIIALLCITPALYLLFRSFEIAGGNLVSIILTKNVFLVFFRTISIIFLVSVVSCIVAVFSAWVIEKTDIPFKKVLTLGLILPLVIPSFILATTVVELYSPRGQLQKFLSIFGVDRLPEIYGLPGATFVLVIMTYPYVFLIVRGALRRLDPQLLEASRSLGYGSYKTFFFITIPLLRPAIAAGTLLAALYTLSDYGGMALLRYNTFTVNIMTLYDASINRSLPSILSLLLVFFALFFIFIEYFTRGKGVFHRSTSGSEKIAKPLETGALKWALVLILFLIILLSLITPIGVLFYWLIRGLINGNDLLPLLNPVLNSLYVAFLASFFTVLTALPVAIFITRYKHKLNNFIEFASYIGFGLPGIVVALSLVFLSINLFFPLYQSIWLLIFSYIVLFIPASIGSIRASVLQVNPRLEDAAYSLGKTPIMVILRVTLPLIMPGILSGGIIVFLLTLKELPATLILSPIGYDTLSTTIWGAATEAFFTRTGGASLILILIAGIPMAFMTLKSTRYNIQK